MADKHSIAQLLRQHAERWNSPAEIKNEIVDVRNRTLRRWLGELVHDHLDSSRMGGLGITQKQLEAWLNLMSHEEFQLKQ